MPLNWGVSKSLTTSIGDIPPVEYELMYYQQLEESFEAA